MAKISDSSDRPDSFAEMAEDLFSSPVRSTTDPRIVEGLFLGILRPGFFDPDHEFLGEVEQTGCYYDL